MQDKARPRVAEPQEKQTYQEPLLIKHEPLRNITGQKYGDKNGFDKEALE
jgi:hypothetical protein